MIIDKDGLFINRSTSFFYFIIYSIKKLTFFSPLAVFNYTWKSKWLHVAQKKILQKMVASLTDKDTIITIFREIIKAYCSS